MSEQTSAKTKSASAQSGIARIFRGFRAFFQGLRMIREHRLWKYVLFPSLVSLLCAILIIVGAYQGISRVLLTGTAGLIKHLSGLFNVAPAADLSGALAVPLKLLALLFALIVNVILYRAVVSFVVIPFLGPLLNQVERIQIGKSIEISLARDIKNSLFSSLVAVKFAIVGLTVLFVSLCLGPFQVVVNGAVQGYFLGRSAFDYIFEKETESFGDRKRLVRQFRPEILGLGLAFFLVLLIPVLGVLIAPPAGVAGAAIVFHDADRE